MEYEIMAPVGSRESLAAALNAGAGSIYFGIENLNMRAHSAAAFTINDLKEIATICQERGVKTYLTVNTIIYGEDIPLAARIVALADVYDALSSKRVYKESWTEDEVLREIQVQAGAQFDPELVMCFFAVMDNIRQIRLAWPDKDEAAEA